MNASPYRDGSLRARARASGRVRYLPGVGLWPVVLALTVAAPLAMWARRDTRVPSVVVCTTVRVDADTKLCSVSDAHALGAPTQLACRETPAALEKILTPPHPLSFPIVHASELDFPKIEAAPDAECERKQAVSLFDALAGKPEKQSLPPPILPDARAPTVDASSGISAAAARDLVRACATADADDVQRTISVTVLERDYLPSALVMLCALVLALFSMIRRRSGVTVDAAAQSVEIAERAFFSRNRRFFVSLADVAQVVVATGPAGPINGKRVEIVTRSGARIPLANAFAPLTFRVHDRAAKNLVALLVRAHSPYLTDAATRADRPRDRTLFALMAGAALLAIAGFGAARAHARRVQSPAPMMTGAFARVTPASEGSTLLLATIDDKTLAIVSDANALAIRAVNAPTIRTGAGDGDTLVDVFTTTMTSAPGAMVMDARGRLFVTLPRESAIAVLESAHGPTPALQETARISTAAEPVALAIPPSGARLVVVSNFGHALQMFRMDTLAATMEVDLPRSPRAVSVSADGNTAVVTHAVGGVISTVDIGGGGVAGNGAASEMPFAVKMALPQTRHERKISKRRTEFYYASDEIEAPVLQASVTRLGDRLYLPGVVVHTGDTAVRVSDAYYSAENPVEAFHLFTLRAPFARPAVVPDRLTPNGMVVVNNVVTSPGTQSAGMTAFGCLIPRATLADENGEWVYITCDGPGKIHKVDVRAKKRCTGGWDAGFMVGDDPSGIALDEKSHTLLVWSGEAETITTLPLDARVDLGTIRYNVAKGATRDPRREWVHSLAKGARGPRAALLTRGRALFVRTNDARISSGGPACASCHIDGREDGLSWPTAAGPRQTPMLAGRLRGTAPYGWSGDHATMPAYLTQTFKRLGGTGLVGDDEDALLAYLDALAGPAFRVKTREKTAVDRGGAIFHSAKAGCGGCHLGSAGVFTDTESHDVKSRVTGDDRSAFDTPSLLWAGATAPYFHDGRYATLAAVLANTDGVMGHTKHLRDDDRRDLIAYVESLGAAP